MVTILEERPEQILVLDGGNIIPYPNTPYWNVKLKMFEGNRIIYKFEEGVEVVETFDKQIFNCSVNNEVIQIRQNGADSIALAVSQHAETKNSSLFKKIYLQAYSLVYKDKFLQILIKPYPSVVEQENGFVVNDFFMVDRRGEAHVKMPDGKWKRMCVVMKGNVDPMVIQTLVGPIELDVLSQTILAKILFLLQPNLQDEVFTNQVPQYVMNELTMGTKKKTNK